MNQESRIKNQDNGNFFGMIHDSRFMIRGFTFVETLVAIAVLLLAVTAPLSLVYQSLAASRVARNQVTAIYLAQETIEFIRATRDTNALTGNDWLTTLEDCQVEDGCYIDISTSEVRDCLDQCPIMTYNTTTYVYGYGEGVDSAFRRTTWIENVRTDKEIKVTTRVEWYEGIAQRNVTMNEFIYNWE
ncbi:MAG: hypothetical protein AAB458_01995 [Patescibacteria group bacterium]